MTPDADTAGPARRAPEPSAPTRTGLGWFLARRAVRLVVLLVAVATASFVLLQASPIDPVDAYIGADAALVGPEQRALIAERWGLDEPALQRFGSWAGQLLQGNLGHSNVFGQPVADIVWDRFVTSLPLMATAWILSGVIGFAAGLLAGSRPGSWWDRLVTWFAYTLASTPTFWFGLLLLTVFAVQLGVAPVCCAVPIGSLAGEVGLLDRLHHLVLPAVTLSIVGIPPIALHTRQATITAMGSDYVAFARAQGERGRGILVHRVLRNAAAPALLLQFASLAELFGGAVLAEQVFSYPGLGEATVTAATRQDVPLLLGIVLFATVFVFVGNLLGDLLHARLDRRVRLTDHHAELS